MNELMTLNTAELSNKKLVTQFTRINKAIETGNKSKWTIADSIKTIVVDELYTEDFETEKKLADAFGMSRSNLNKIKHLIKVMKNEGMGDGYALEEVEKLWSKDI